jgi:hypothetical protein
MANSRGQNVILCDTTDTTYSGNLTIRAIKYVGNASGTAIIKAGSSSGAQVWEEAGASNAWNPDVELRLPEGFHVTLTNSAKLYIYLK